MSTSPKHVKRPRRKAYHSPQSGTELMSDARPQLSLHGQYKGYFTLSLLFPMARQPLVDQGLLIVRGFTITHFLDIPHSVELLWTSDQPVAETSTLQHTTLTRDTHPCPRRDSNPQSLQARGRRPTPWTGL
jgi:hypothetical protein